MSAADLSVENVSWAPRKHAPLILHPTTFQLSAGRVLGVVGPNGAGKSSLLRVLYRFNNPSTGRVMIDGAEIWSMPPRAAARKVAAVLQEQPTDFALTVGEIVTLGRIPHRLGFSTAAARDGEVIAAALDRLDLKRFYNRSFGTLSGGERQRVMVARALAQEPQVLILDEPTNHLDIRHQLEVLELIRALDLTIVTSLHDLNMAAQICDDILILEQGHTLGFGPPETVLTEARVSDAFQIEARQEWLNPSNTRLFSFHLPSKKDDIA